jgi:GT2 family glycosyltransferase
MAEWFLAHNEYTHLVIAPDDLIVKPEHIALLKQGLEEYNDPILCGFSNIWETDDGLINLSIHLNASDGSFEEIEWMNRSELPDAELFQVEFAGYPCMAIRRDVVEKISLYDEGVFDGKKSLNGGSIDVLFCWRCKMAGIPIWVDSRLDMRHLRSSGKHEVGKKPKHIEFSPQL